MKRKSLIKLFKSYEEKICKVLLISFMVVTTILVGITGYCSTIITPFSEDEKEEAISITAGYLAEGQEYLNDLDSDLKFSMPNKDKVVISKEGKWWEREESNMLTFDLSSKDPLEPIVKENKDFVIVISIILYAGVGFCIGFLGGVLLMLILVLILDSISSIKKKFDKGANENIE